MAGCFSDVGRYREDIDGLRAVAVLMVVLYHAGLGFPGGFLGVDVFFVISGYLITLHILADVAANRFSLGNFWVRRVRRLLPASLVALCATLFAGCWLFLPADLGELSRSAAASTVFSANFFFWGNTGYFDGSVDLKPLLHFWSLAVEEQFYFFYPLFLVWCPPLNRRGKLIFSAAFLLCLLVGSFGHLRYPSAAFYLLPCRAWELLLGGVLCLLPDWTTRWDRVRWWVCGSGLLAIAFSCCVARSDWAYWFPPPMLPCLGAAAIIVAGKSSNNVVTKILGSGPLVAIGAISYSLYLWHWPLLAFVRHLEVDLQFEEIGLGGRVVCVLVACGLAAASYYFVEQPFRRRIWLGSDAQFLLASGAVVGGLLVTSLGIIASEGLPQRFDARVLRYAAAAEDYSGKFVRSMNAAEVTPETLYACGARESRRRWLLFGDSHAICLLPGVEPLAVESGIRIDQATRFSTAPLLGFDHLAIWRNDGAGEFVDAVMQSASSDLYECVILFAAWDAYADWPTFSDSLRKGVSNLLSSGKVVVFVLPVPNQRGNVPMLLAGAVRRGLEVDRIGVSIQERELRLQRIMEVLEPLADRKLILVDPVPALLGSNGLVRAELDGEALYCDYTHLSHAGSRRVAGAIFRRILDAVSR